MEARRLDHPRVGTEHLLLGLLSDDDGEPADVLRAAGISLIAARHKVVEALGADAGSPNSEALPFTPRAQRALERAGRFSRKDQQPEVTAGHVLLGVLDVEGLACQVLRGLGADIVHLRNAVVTTPVPVALVDDQPLVDLYAGIYVSAYETAKAWYVQLFGTEPAFLPSETEAVWVLAAQRSIYIQQNIEHAGHAVHTILVGDLDDLVARIAERGIEPTHRDTYENGMRKVSYQDPDGNEIGFGGAPLAAE